MNTISYLLSPIGQAQTPGFEWAIFVVAAAIIGLLGAMIGYAASRFLESERIKKSQAHIAFLQEEHTTVQLEATKLKEDVHQNKIQLKGQHEQADMLRSQLKATQHTLDQAKEGWNASVKEVQTRNAAINDLRATTESLHLQLTNIDQTARERNHEMDILKNQMAEATMRYKELQRIATERQAALAVANAEISRFRSRFMQVGNHTIEANSQVRAVLLQLEAIHQRVLDLELVDLEDNLIDSTSTDHSPKTNGHNGHNGYKNEWAEPQQPVLQPSKTIVSPSVSASINLDPLDIHTRDFDAPAAVTLMEDESRPPDIDDEDESDNIVEDLFDAPAPVPQPVKTYGRSADLSSIRALHDMGAEDALRLEAAGVLNLQAMAHMSEAQLKQIIRAPRWRTPPYGQWIAEAQQLIGG